MRFLLQPYSYIFSAGGAHLDTERQVDELGITHAHARSRTVGGGDADSDQQRARADCGKSKSHPEQINDSDQ